MEATTEIGDRRVLDADLAEREGTPSTGRKSTVGHLLFSTRDFLLAVSIAPSREPASHSGERALDNAATARIIAAFDLTYDVSTNWSIGGKVAYRMGQVSLDRVNRVFFDSAAQLAVLRVDWRFLRGWESLAEVRMLDLPDVNQRRIGALAAVYRYFGKHLKAGVGYNFTDFSDDLTDLSYDHQGAFVNLVGSM